MAWVNKRNYSHLRLDGLKGPAILPRLETYRRRIR